MGNLKFTKHIRQKLSKIVQEWSSLRGTEKFKANPNKKDGDNMSCAIVATRKGHLEVARVLLDNKADYSVADKNDCTAIHYVMACKPNEELIDALYKSYGMSAFTKVTD